ncbi:uncharacterized protein LOC133790429 [Humulus lupulus]|uniref:uncharacterized protein LOC133790429 n=1 Tax=Humulus lupulus TaxID=3486 RepID=UPI002B412A26|nr:uncharacterized protein LOC133790429 [Humulus lupulus]
MDTGAESPESLSEWEQIDSPFSPPHVAGTHVHLQQDHSPDSPSSSSSSSSPTPAVSSSSSTNLRPNEEEARRRPESDSRLAAVKEFKKQLRLRFGILKTDVLGVAAKVCNYRLVAVWRFWSIVSVAGAITAVLLSFIYAKLWRPRWRPRVLPRRRRENNEPLLLLLKEKDEKISQLLVQIAQMNEALSARRRVPVIRVG